MHLYKTNVLLVCEGEVGELVQPGGMWGRTAFKVCFVGLVVERICVWCLVIVFTFMGFGQGGAKRCGGCLKVISCGWWCKSQKGAFLIGKIGSHYVILLYCENLLQVLLGIYCKRFYWIPLFTILLFYMFEVGKAKSATQSVLLVLTLNSVSFTSPFSLFFLFFFFIIVFAL